MTREFLNKVAEYINEKNLFPGCEALVQEVVKPNVTKLAIVIRSEGLSPTIYEDTFEDVDSVNEAVDIITKIVKSGPSIEIDHSDILGTIRRKLPNVQMRVVNYDRNAAIVEEYAGRKIMDLYVFYCVALTSDGESQSSVAIKNGMLDILGVTEEDLYLKALDNLDKECSLMNMGDILRERFKDDSMTMMLLEGSEDASPMYVLSNKNCIYGASQILNTKRIKELADKLDSDVVVIPSSIHELILVPANIGFNEDELKDLIGSINTQCVAPTEYLGSHPYYFSKNEEGYLN